MKQTRIETLASLVRPTSKEVWDLCCDHGKIGLAVHKRLPQARIHFVDQVPAIIDLLSVSIAAHIPKGFYSIKCKDVRTLQFSNDSSIIMAGVGGILMVEFLQKLLSQISELNLKNIQLILSPHQDIHLVRDFLSDKFTLEREVLVIEKKVGYEMLDVLPGSDPTRKVSLIGDQMWDLRDSGHLAYATKHLKYLRLKYQHSPALLESKVLKLFELLMLSK